MEDDLWWKMTFSGTQPSVEYYLQCKKTFGGCCIIRFAAFFDIDITEARKTKVVGNLASMSMSREYCKTIFYRMYRKIAKTPF